MTNLNTLHEIEENDDKQVVKEAYKKNVRSFDFASDELKNDE